MQHSRSFTHTKSVTSLFLLILFLLGIASCSRGDDQEKEIAIAVALTQTAAAAEDSPETDANQAIVANTPTAPPPDDATSTPTSTLIPDTSASPTPILPPAQVFSTDASILPAPLYFIDGNSSQIMRLEMYGEQLTQITNESEAITAFDISLTEDRLIYVTNNQLIEVDPSGNRIIKASSEPLTVDNLDKRVNLEITNPRFSPDGERILYGHNGINLIATGEGASPQLIQASDPLPDLDNLPETPPRFYFPGAWSPDGNQLLVNVSFWPEAGTLAIQNLVDGSLHEISSVEPNGITCCEWAWAPSASSGIIASNLLAYGTPGLAYVNAETGNATTWIYGTPDGEVNQTNPFQFFNAPYLIEEETLLLFYSRMVDLNQPTQYTMYRVDILGEGVTEFTPLRSDSHALNGTVLWANDGSGAVVVDTSDPAIVYPNGTISWLPSNDTPVVVLPATGQQPRWGPLDTRVESSDKSNDAPELALNEESLAGLISQAAVDMEIDFTQENGFEGTHAQPIQLEMSPDFPASQPLWAVYTLGVRNFDIEQDHMIAIYSNETEGDNVRWLQLAQLALSNFDDPINPRPGPDYLAEFSVSQVVVEPSRIWLQIEGGVGAHGGTYHLLSFDGTNLKIEADGFSASSGAGTINDIDGDGIGEVLTDATDYYVFCYACGVREVEFKILRWDGTQMVPVKLSPLDASAPTVLNEFNSQAIAQAEVGLWQTAQQIMEEAKSLGPDAGTEDPTFAWNAHYIQLNAEARRDAISGEDIGYPLLGNLFYGDYAAVVEIMRAYPVEQIFDLQTPLVIGTVAEGWVDVLSERILSTVEPALALEPNLAPGYFLRGWARWLATPGDPAVLSDLELAIERAPDDSLYTATLAYLTSDTTAPSTVGELTAAVELNAAVVLNIRSGPGVEHPIIGELAVGDVASVIGRSSGELWWQIEHPSLDQSGWVYGDPGLATISGIENNELENVPVVGESGETPSAVSSSGRILYSAQDVEDGRTNTYAITVNDNLEATGEPSLLVHDAIHPRLQPAGSRLAFYSTRDDMLGVGGFDLETEERLRFSFNIEDSHPSWNPTGEQLVFASNRESDRGWRLYRTWADDSDYVDVLGSGQDPDWHPNAERIVYKGCGENGANCGLWIMGSDGSDRQLLTDNPSDSRPRWSPEGQFVVFMSNERDGNWELYRLAMDSGVILRLTNHPNNDGLPAISPNGQWIAFISDRDGVWQIWVISIDGSSTQLIAPISGNLPNWLEQGVEWSEK